MISLYSKTVFISLIKTIFLKYLQGLTRKASTSNTRNRPLMLNLLVMKNTKNMKRVTNMGSIINMGNLLMRTVIEIKTVTMIKKITGTIKMTSDLVRTLIRILKNTVINL